MCLLFKWNYTSFRIVNVNLKIWIKICLNVRMKEGKIWIPEWFYMYIVLDTEMKKKKIKDEKNKKNGAHVFSAILHTISSPRGDFGLLGSIRYTPFPVTTPKPLSGKIAHLRALDRYPNPSPLTPCPHTHAIWCRYGAHHLLYGVDMVRTIC